MDETPPMAINTDKLNLRISFIKAGFSDCSVDLNQNKCEWFGNDYNRRGPDATSFKYCPNGLKTVGCYVSRSHARASGMLAKKLAKHAVFFERIGKLHPYFATTLLAVCGIPRMGYYPRAHHPVSFAPPPTRCSRGILGSARGRAHRRGSALPAAGERIGRRLPTCWPPFPRPQTTPRSRR
jgi:hypothetical protein